MRVEDLPGRIAEYMGSHFATLKTLRLVSRYHLNDEQRDAYVLLLADVFTKELELEQVPNQLKERLNIDAGTSFMLAAESAEQHFATYADFLGDVSALITQWHAWGKEFGGQQPGPLAEPKVERMIARAGQVQGRRIEMQRLSSQATQRAPAAAPTPKPTPVPQQAQPAPAPAAPANPGMSREQFLSQVQQFSIDKLRPAGQPAVQRLQQIRSSLSHVVSTTPADQQAVAQALHASPLFRLYQDMGQESLRTQQSIDHVIYGRYQAGQPYLLREEFDAVGQLATIATPANQPATA